MKTKLKKLIFSKKFQISVLLFCVVLIFSLAPVFSSVQAQDNVTVTEASTDLTKNNASPNTFLVWTARFLGAIASLLLFLIGLIFSLEVRLLMWVVSYNSFVTSAPVNYGWTLIRDISNLFFVLILLVIAISTILRYESYNIKKLLPKLLLMAILVNFSLTISALILDAAQVVMLTFVAAFAGTAGEGNLVSVLHIDAIVKSNTNAQSGDWSIVNIAITLMLSVVLMLIAVVVIGVILMVFVFRIVMIWILLVLSPLAYILSAFPQGEKYASQWWAEYSKYVIIGPILAFFLWLTFAIATAETSSNLLENAIKDPEKPLAPVVGADSVNQGGGALSGVAQVDQFAGFVVAIAMLLGSLVITQQMGVAGGSLAGQAMGKIKGAGSKVLGFAKSVP